MSNPIDALFMQRAIEQSRKARFIAPPNPWVGCVIVKDGEIVGEGFTQAPGGDHAEILALNAAGSLAKGSTAYVTLEPCAHFGKTPPCGNALIQAGVARVVIALQDPDPQVNGKGISLLQKEGISVTVGICAEEVAQSLHPYIHQRRTGRPWCVVKSAVSIDGRIAAADGTSQWITSTEARQDTHFLRAESQAIVIGAGTALTDKPKLTVRDVSFLGKHPLRVLLDSRGRVSPADQPFFDPSLGPSVVLTTPLCPSERVAEWKSTGVAVQVLPCAVSNQGVNLSAVLDFLNKKGVIQVLFEGGAAVIGNLWKEGFVDQWTVYVGACILGETGYPALKGVIIPTIDAAPRFHLMKVTQIHDCVRLDYRKLDLGGVVHNSPPRSQ